MFRFKVSRLANFFFFISNLSEWHFSCRPNYNTDWLKHSGKLTIKEKKALNEFKKIMNDYGFFYKNREYKYLGQVFFLNEENEVWDKLKDFVTEKEFIKIKEIFELFNPRFKKVWDKEKLIIWQKKLNRILRSKSSSELFEDLKIILGPPQRFKNKITTVHLLFSPSDNSPAGGANLGETNLTLEVPIYKITKWNMEFAVSILAHELAHIYLKNSKILGIIKSRVRKFKKASLNHIIPQRPIFEYVSEILIGAFVPLGYLSQKYFKNYKPLDSDWYFFENLDKALKEFKNFERRKSSFFYWLERYFVWQLYPVAGYYQKTRKKIDKEFVDLILNFLKIK